MSGTFADSARRLSGLVPRVRGWTPDAFWAATPAELAAIFSPEAEAAAPLSRRELNSLMERERDG